MVVGPMHNIPQFTVAQARTPHLQDNSRTDGQTLALNIVDGNQLLHSTKGGGRKVCDTSHMALIAGTQPMIIKPGLFGSLAPL